MNAALKNKNVLISGASIGGPALAYWLSKFGFKVTVVEKAQTLREGGYRVDIRGVAVEVATRMGVMNNIRESATNMKGSSFINSEGKRLVNINDPNIMGMRREGETEIMRGTLAGILYEATRNNVEYIFDDSITGIVQKTESVLVTFKNSPEREFDLVAGADGLHSNVRNIAFGQEKDFIRNFGFYFAIFTIPNQFKLDHWELSYMSEARIMNIFSTGNDHEAKAMCMFGADNNGYDYKDIQSQKKRLHDLYKADGGFILRLMESLKDTPDFYFDTISQVRMNSLSRGRVVLLGDAGYCPSPAAGQGTSLALTGAYVLAGELARANGEYEAAYANYERQMKQYIEINQQLIDGVEKMFPKSKKQAWVQLNVMRLLFSLPWKEKVLKRMFKKMQQKVDDAANGIMLKDYGQYSVN